VRYYSVLLTVLMLSSLLFGQGTGVPIDGGGIPLDDNEFSSNAVLIEPPVGNASITIENTSGPVNNNQYAIINNLHISGYYENDFNMYLISDEVLTQDYNRIRIDIESKPSKHVMTRIGFIGNNYLGLKSFPYIQLLPRHVVDTAGISSEYWQYFNYTFKDSIVLDNAYIVWSPDFLQFKIGKQTINRGTGYVWNPTDVFNTKNAFDPTYEKPGVTAAVITRTWKHGGNANIILTPAEQGKYMKKELILQQKLGFTWTASYCETPAATSFLTWKNMPMTVPHMTIPGMYTLVDVPIAVEQRIEKRAGGDFVGDIHGLEIRGEGVYILSGNADGQEYWEALGGMQYFFSIGMMMMTEYFYNSAGRAGADEYTFNDWLRYYIGETDSLAQHYLFYMIQQNIGAFGKGSTSVLYNVDDNSVGLIPRLDWSLAENFDLTVFGLITTGTVNSEYYAGQSQAQIRVKVYF